MEEQIRPNDDDVAQLWAANPVARLQLQNITLVRIVKELQARVRELEAQLEAK